MGIARVKRRGLRVKPLVREDNFWVFHTEHQVVNVRMISGSSGTFSRTIAITGVPANDSSVVRQLVAKCEIR